MNRDLLVGENYKEIKENIFEPISQTGDSRTELQKCDDVASGIMLDLAEVVRPIPVNITIGGYVYICHNGLYYRPEVLDAMYEQEDANIWI